MIVRDKAFYRTIFKIALPSAFQALMGILIVLADDAMVSSLGDAAFAGVSQANRITMFYTATIMGLVSGSSVLISQYWGKKDTQRIKRIFSIVLSICFGISILFVLLVQLFPSLILGIVIGKNEQEIISYAMQYFRIACFAYIPYALSNALVGMLRSVEVVGITLIIAIASLIMNIFLNYVLIFGKLGMPAMGVQGADNATVIVRVVELCITTLYVFRVQKSVDIKPKDFLRMDRQLVKDYGKYGLPVGFADMQWALVGMLKASIIGRLGAEFIAANSITEAMANLGTLFSFALAGGACVVVGKTVGAGDYKKAREYSNTIQILFFIFGLTMATLVYFIRPLFINIYQSSPETKELASTMIAICAVTMIGTTYHASCFVGINRGAGDSRFVAMVDMICGWLIVLPITYLAAFVFHWPLPIVFLCTRIDQCFKWIIAFFRLRGDKWIKNVTRDTEDASVKKKGVTV